MLGGCSAAPAHHADVVLVHEFDHSLSEIYRIERVDGFPIHVERQTSVRDARDWQGSVISQEADWLAHVLRSG